MKTCFATLVNLIKNLHPAHFAMIMATGIISMAFKAMGYERIAVTLFILNLIIYFFLFFLLAARALFFGSQVMMDLKTPRRAWPFLTFIVGANTIGAQLVLFMHAAVPAAMLWVFALAAWLLCIYLIGSNMAAWIGRPIEEIVDGATLLIAVSTESIGLLGMRLLEASDIQNGGALLVIWIFWLAGLLSYFLIMPLLIYRIFWRPMELRDWNGPYWICMGAVAIITLTGAEILLHIPLAAPWEEMRAVTRILMLMAWVTATVWIPYLVIMDIRKFTRIGLPGAPPFWVRFFPWARLAFGRRGCSHFFEPSSWGRVFPMGMYTACTLDLTQATEFEFLKIIPSYWGWCALVIWGLTFTGALRTVSSLTYCRCHIISLKE